jgi:hypothetical protein
MAAEGSDAMAAWAAAIELGETTLGRLRAKRIDSLEQVRKLTETDFAAMKLNIGVRIKIRS